MQNAPISKHQLCWLIIRVAAISLLATALIDLLALIQGPLLIGELLPSKIVLSVILTLLVKLTIGIHLLRNGNWLHKLLMTEAPPLKTNTTRELKDSPAPPITQAPKSTPKPEPEPVNPVTRLTEKETQLFENWLAANPEYVPRNKLDQIALFRDYLRKLYE